MRNKLILASTSTYRRALLQRLQLPFEVVGPMLDESRLAAETACEASVRLARQKAEHVAASAHDSTIIGSDQLAQFSDRILGKAGSARDQIAQLRQLSGAMVRFYTAICVIHQPSQMTREAVVPIEAQFRTLSAEIVERYVAAEPAWDCAGGFK